MIGRGYLGLNSRHLRTANVRSHMSSPDDSPACRRPIKKIDIHTHIIPENWPDWNKVFGYNEWLTIEHDQEGAKLLNPDGTLFRRIHPNCWCPAARISECDQNGVDIQVTPTLFEITFAIDIGIVDSARYRIQLQVAC